MASKEDALPSNWVLLRIGEFLHTSSGGTPDRSKPEYYGNQIPWLKSGELTDSIVNSSEECISKEGLEHSSAKIIPKGSLLIAMYGATTGKVAILGIDSAINQAICAVQTHGLIEPKFLFYFFQSYRNKLLYARKGGAQPNINQNIIREIELPLPPLAEQQRIVKKIEELLNKTELARNELAHSEKKIDNFLLSVQLAAVNGKLSMFWREKNADKIRPSSVTIQEFIEQKKKRGNKKNIEQIKRIFQCDELPTIPSTWTWATFEQISERVTVGHVGKMKNEYVDNGIPFLRSQNIRENKFEPQGLTFISKIFHDKLEKSKIQPGDLVIVRSGNVGVACVIPPEIGEANCSDMVIVKQPMALDPYFAAIYMNSMAKYRVHSKKVGVALIHFNTKSMAEMPIPIPPIEEQEFIVRLMKQEFEEVQFIKEQISKGIVDFNLLRQSILSKAFKGTLVPQDSNDEPASVLLGKIEKESSKAKKSR